MARRLGLMISSNPFGRHALHGELAEAGGSLGALTVEAQGVVEGDLGKGYFFFHK